MRFKLFIYGIMAAAMLAVSVCLRAETTNAMSGVAIPFANYPVATTRTNVASQIIRGVNLFATNTLAYIVLPVGSSTNFTGSGGIVATQSGGSVDMSGTNLIDRAGARAMLAPLNLGGFAPTNAANGSVPTGLMTVGQFNATNANTIALSVSTNDSPYLLAITNATVTGPLYLTRSGRNISLTWSNDSGFVTMMITNGLDTVVARDTAIGGATNTIAGASITGTAADSVYPNAVLSDGSRAWTAAHNAGGFSLTNLLNGTELLHAVNLGQLQGATNGLDTVAARNTAIGGATNTIAAASLTGTIADARQGANIANTQSNIVFSGVNTYTQAQHTEMLWVYGFAASGGTDTKIIRYGNLVQNTFLSGTALYVTNAANGSTFTILKPGQYSINNSYSSLSPSFCGISLNSTELTTSITLINPTNRLSCCVNATANWVQSSAVTAYFASGAVLLVHHDGGAAGTSTSTNLNELIISRVSD